MHMNFVYVGIGAIIYKFVRGFLNSVATNLGFPFVA